MSELRRRLDLPAVLEHLVERAMPWPLDEAVAVATSVAGPGQDLDAHQLLAVLMLRQPIGLLESLDVAAGPGLTVAERHELAAFLLHLALIYRPLRAYDAVAVQVPPTAGELAISALVRDAVGPGLVHLAELVVITQPAGALVVVEATLEAAAGRYERRVDGGLILLDLEACAGAVDEVFAHELGHALDPAPGLLVALEERERFADDLGALLLDRLPVDPAGVYALVAEVLEERAPSTVGVDAVLDDAAALAWYAGVDLTPAPALISLKG